MSLSIDLYCADGSPMGLIPLDIHGKGVGGAELAMMTWAETMARRGHQVRIYNDPIIAGVYAGVEYLPLSDFDFRASREVFIVYRAPNRFIKTTRAAVKLFWSTDQYTSGDFARDIFPFVDRTVCISPYHVIYHKKRYRAENIGYFDLGVRVEEYENTGVGVSGKTTGVRVEGLGSKDVNPLPSTLTPVVQKVPGRCIFCSVPERGLEVLRMIWPKIKERVPNASLVITSDYTLWGAASPLNHEHRLKWLGVEGVEFMGKIPRKQLVIEQLKAVCMPYPCTYSELFCISAAECQVAGAVPVTSAAGALPTTNEWGVMLAGNILESEWQSGFVEHVVTCLEDRYFIPIKGMRKDAVWRFDWNTICGQWEHLIETGEFTSELREPVHSHGQAV